MPYLPNTLGPIWIEVDKSRRYKCCRRRVPGDEGSRIEASITSLHSALFTMKSYAFLSLIAVAVCEPIVYMIRHGEKPEDDGVGLSPEGVQRAQCIRSVFGSGSQYNIGHIMAQEYKESLSRLRRHSLSFEN